MIILEQGREILFFCFLGDEKNRSRCKVIGVYVDRRYMAVGEIGVLGVFFGGDDR
jgi:hypothetical protein